MDVHVVLMDLVLVVVVVVKFPILLFRIHYPISLFRKTFSKYNITSEMF